ncbi:MAG: hypothetical protein KDA92_00650 [Planctomycetales bacterium]|nr:hypothetical protein [Planctomycetales bacterium]MCA9166265.1 hypothetical protein [Planctomycetales bacterium]
MDGRFVYAAVFAAVIVWLLVVPTSRLYDDDQVRPWYRNVRFWAICVAATQVIIYLAWNG